MLRALRAPFLAARKGTLIQPQVVAWLDERIQSEPAVLDYWGMRLEIGNAAERAEVVERLSRAYRRGDIAAYQHADVVNLLVRDAKELAAPWIERAPSSWSSFSEVERHAGWLRAVGLGREAALYMAEARGKSLFQRAEEIQAFDFWRRNIDAGEPRSGSVATSRCASGARPRTTSASPCRPGCRSTRSMFSPPAPRCAGPPRSRLNSPCSPPAPCATSRTCITWTCRAINPCCACARLDPCWTARARPKRWAVPCLRSRWPLISRVADSKPPTSTRAVADLARLASANGDARRSAQRPRPSRGSQVGGCSNPAHGTCRRPRRAAGGLAPRGGRTIAPLSAPRSDFRPGVADRRGRSLPARPESTAASASGATMMIDTRILRLSFALVAALFLAPSLAGPDRRRGRDCLFPKP